MSQAPILEDWPEPLRRPFRALVFDWDGTAVASRQEDTTELAGLVDQLLGLSVWIVVITGTNFGHVDRQLCRLVAPLHRRHLLVCTNRGSEVYGFGQRGAPARRWLRLATPEEERALTAIAENVRATIAARTGLDTAIVYDRLNRRKIDLIPLPAWADPPKACFDQLLAAVERRLRDAGLAGGLAEVVALTQRLAREHGLPDARVTSDAKHVEVGLTDKGDSLQWARRHLLQPLDIPMADVLVAGDELGPVAGVPGSDDRLRLEAASATVLSVGVEPAGVPEGVVHLGGGPPRFRALLADQLRRWREQGVAAGKVGDRDGAARHRTRPAEWTDSVLRPTADPAWRLEAAGYRPALEHEVESRFAVGNGHLGVRGSLEQPTAGSRPRTFVAGLFDLPDREPAVPALVPAPDWLRLRLMLDGSALAPGGEGTLTHARTLDLLRGVLLSEWRHRDASGRTIQLRTLRFVSLAHRVLAVHVAQLHVDQPVQTALEARLGPASRDLHPLDDHAPVATWRTRHSGRRLAMAAAFSLRVDRARLSPRVVGEPHWTWSAAPGQAATLGRLIAIARGDAEHDPRAPASTALRDARRTGARRLLVAHTRAWRERWASSDVAIEGDDASQRALRFAVYHLASAANPEDEHVSIGARGLTGDAYAGHVFWDTDVFALPFFTFTWPDAARALLMYRYHTLPAARAKAARLGFRGALYAWESADTGEETTPPYVVRPNGRAVPIRSGTDEQHISADVAYAVWQYWRATGDEAFLHGAGAEVILETARFWASRAMLEQDGSYHIRGVIGPDEYHEHVDDNAYTNAMARWNLKRGLDVAELLETRWPARWAHVSEQLDVDEAELSRWRDVGTRMATGFDASTRLFEQFGGFFRLEPIDLTAFARRAAPMDLVLGAERTRLAQVIKQADVVMLLALLWEDLDQEVADANFRYYEPRCGHGSSLSPAIHALVAARLGDVDLAERYFRQAAAIDLDDTLGNAALGVHVGALGGLWQAAVFGFAGVALAGNGLRVAPRMPPSWRTMRFALQWHRRRIRIEVQPEPGTVTVGLERGKPLLLSAGGALHTLRTAAACTCRYHETDVRLREVPE